MPQWQLNLRRFFKNIWIEVAVGVLVLISVGLTLMEFALETQNPRDVGMIELLMWLNDAITFIFIVELSLRYFAASSKREFFKSFWLDIIAVLPLFRVFRFGRALRLLRLVRIFRLFGVASRLTSHYPYIFRRGAWDFMVITGLIGVTIVFGTVAMMYFEHRAPVAEGEAQFNLDNSFWFSLYTLFAGEPIPGPPQTIAGRIVAVFIMFMGLTIFAIFAGTVSAFMVDRIRMEGKVNQLDDLKDHIVICGWSNKTEIVIREYRVSPSTRKIPIVVITELPSESIDVPPEIRTSVTFLHDDFTRIPALERAGIHRASTCLILSDATGHRNEQDSDARTILAALTVEKINPDVYTCAELINRDYGSHLDIGHVNEYVVSSEYSAYILAQAAMNRGLMGVLGELMTCERGNEFFRASIAERHIGSSFFDLLVELKQQHNAILVGVYGSDGSVILNPHDYQFKKDDEIVAICDRAVSLS